MNIDPKARPDAARPAEAPWMVDDSASTGLSCPARPAARMKTSMRHAFEQGMAKSDRTGPRIVFGHPMRFDPKGGFPWFRGAEPMVMRADRGNAYLLGLAHI